jgi:hypothetical protein
MTSLLKKLVWAGSAFAMLAASSAYADAPSYVRVRSLNYAGSGCPAGSVATNVSPDLQAFTLLFDDYIAEVGPGISAREKRKNCVVNVDLDFPQGWSYTVFTVDYRGFLDLERGMIGTQQTSYYFQGSSSTARLRTNSVGPISNDYHIRDTLGVSALVWSPCGASRSLNMNTEVRIDNSRNRRGAGLMTIDSIDGQLKHIYGVQWRRCR